MVHSGVFWVEISSSNLLTDSVPKQFTPALRKSALMVWKKSLSLFECEMNNVGPMVLMLPLFLLLTSDFQRNRDCHF